MNTTEKEIETWGREHAILATEVIRQAKRQTRKWFTAFLVTLVVLISTNTAWALYEYSTVTEQEAER